MAKFDIKVDSIFGGWSPTSHFGSEGQFYSSLAIDPDMPVTDAKLRPSGLIRPTSMAKISGTAVDAAPMWIVTNPKDSNAYWYSKDGKVGTIDTSNVVAALNSDTALTTATGNGAAYYDNYIYFAKDADICRYGPLNGAAAFTQNFWTNSLSLTAPTDTTYPTVRGIEMPNHPMFADIDQNKLYYGDVNSSNQGIISTIGTTKTTVEGDTNDGSAYAAVVFGHSMWPTCIESYGHNIAVGLVQGTNATTKQRSAAIAFWDKNSDDPLQYISVELPDPLVTAIKNVNGVLYVFTGSADGGTRVLVFSGGYSFSELAYLPETTPPFAGAVDHLLNRVVFGGWTTEPSAAACVYAIGSQSKSLPMGLHNILKTTSANTTNQTATCVKYLRHEGQLTQPHVGWKDGASQGIDALSTTYTTSTWRSAIYRVGVPFDLHRIRIPVSPAITTNHTMTVKVFVDDEVSSVTVATVNTSSKWTGKRYIDIQLTPTTAVGGNTNFFVEIAQSGSALLTVGLPIVVNGSTKETE